jgi:hypothetical protein
MIMLTAGVTVNEARAMRVMELMNDFRTLQIHITSLITRSEANPPDQQSYYLDGYVVLRQCAAESQAVLAGHFNPGSLGLQAGNVPETEVQKATLQRYEITTSQRAYRTNWLKRIILDASTRRFQAHKIYLRASAGMRWVQMRAQVLRGEKPAAKHVNALRAVDQRLRQVSFNFLEVDEDCRSLIVASPHNYTIYTRLDNHVARGTRDGSDLRCTKTAPKRPKTLTLGYS